MLNANNLEYLFLIRIWKKGTNQDNHTMIKDSINNCTKKGKVGNKEKGRKNKTPERERERENNGKVLLPFLNFKETLKLGWKKDERICCSIVY